MKTKTKDLIFNIVMVIIITSFLVGVIVYGYYEDQKIKLKSEGNTCELKMYKAKVVSSYYQPESYRTREKFSGRAEIIYPDDSKGIVVEYNYDEGVVEVGDVLTSYRGCGSYNYPF